jgi:hypothetical protein
MQQLLDQLKETLKMLGIAAEEIDMVAEDLLYDILARSVQSLSLESDKLPEIQQAFATGNFNDEIKELIAKFDQAQFAQAMSEQAADVLNDFVAELQMGMDLEQKMQFTQNLTQLANKSVVESLDKTDSDSVLQKLSN